MEFFDEPVEPIDLTKSPREPWFHTAYFFSQGTRGVAVHSANWIERSFAQKERLRRLLNFVSQEFDEGVSGRLGALERVWFFPWTEAALELKYAFANALLGLHRACVDHQRRALELVIVGAYFIADGIDEKAGRAWLNSEISTPMFTRALKVLLKEDLCSRFVSRTKWDEYLSRHYWQLCDTVHVRGYEHSLSRLQDSRTRLDGLLMPRFSTDALQRSLARLMETASQMLLLLALSNPILLFGVPLEEKYGVDGPIGFFTEWQSDELRELLPVDFGSPLIAIAEEDPIVASLRQNFDSLPDISAEDFRRQLDDLR